MFSKYHYQGFLETQLLWDSGTYHGLSPIAPVAQVTILLEDNTKIPVNEILGKRAEYYFERTLEQDRRYEVIAKNIQIFKHKITLGELDFIVKDNENDTILHIEVAYKFYLYDPEYTSSEIKYWIGPNRKDSLDEKISTLKYKQLPLLFTRETRKVLLEKHLDPDKIEQKVAYYGHLFLPQPLYKRKFNIDLNPECISGYWIAAKDLKGSLYENADFYLPEKNVWMVHPKHNVIWKGFKVIHHEIKYKLSLKKSPLVWMKSKDDFYQRFFVVWWK